jgi:hypothetical protein
MKLRCYKNEDGMWAAHMVDTQTGEQVGSEVVSDDNETAVFKLGLMYGGQQNKLAYLDCDLVARMIAGYVKHFDIQRLLWKVSRSQMDLNTDDEFVCTPQIIEIQNPTNGKTYQITSKEINQPTEELFDVTDEAIENWYIWGMPWEWGIPWEK